MPITRQKKETILKDLNERLSGTSSVVFVNFHGVSVAEATAARKALKEKVLVHYGYKCNCGCGCQVANSNHLTIDHINNDGHIHRKQLGTKIRGGQAFYRWIVKNNFPKDLQILCWNCNCAKEFYGGCK